MKRKQNRPRTLMLILLLPLLLALLSLGCGLSGAIAGLRAEPEFVPTRTPMPTFTPAPTGVAFIEVPIANESEAVEAEPVSADLMEAQEQPSVEVAEPDPQPEQAVEQPRAPEPTEEVAPTLEPVEEAPPADDVVTVTVLQDMNVRGGPGTDYPRIGVGPAGASSKVVGRNADGSWLQVEYPPGSSSTGWLFAQLVEVTGNPETAQVVAVDPPPQPVAAAPAPQEEAPPPEPEVKYQFTPTGWHASENAAIVHFKGRIKDESGNLVNGYSVRLDNWSFSIISHPTGASHWYPEKGDGEWDVSGVPLAAGQGWWWLSVVRYECDFWAGFDSQCKNFTTLSEEVKIEVRTPEESVINADWICHWDCDKGLYTEGFRRPD